MSETIKKSLGEGHGKGELYAALAHDTGDKFGGMEIKSILMNFTTYDETTGDGRVCFANREMYIAPYTTTELDIYASSGVWIISDHIYMVGDVHYFGESHETSTTEFDVLLTDPTTAANAIHGLIDAGGAWTAGNMVAIRGKVDVSGGLAICSATGVWAGLEFLDAVSTGTGLTCALNAEVVSDNATKPNAIVYIQSLPAAGANFSNVPYIVFAEEAGGTGSNILFEVGHDAAAKVPTLESDMLFWQDTLRIAVNKVAGTRTKYYIPLSTVTGTFTYAYLVALTNVETIDVTLTSSLLSALAITTTSADTTGGTTVILPLYVDATMSGDGGLGRAIEGKLTVTGKLGDYGNAIKGYTVLTGGSGCAGLVSAICAEMKMPGGTALGTFGVLELELVCPESWTAGGGVGTNCTSFIYAQVSDNASAIGEFEHNGYLLNLQGLSDDTSHLWYDNTLRIAIGSTAWYLPMSTVAGTFTTEYPIVSSYASRAIDITDGFFRIGAQDEGVPLVDAYPYAMEIHVKTASDIASIPVDGLANASGLSCGIRCRYEVAYDQANQISMIAIEGRLRPKKDLGDGCHAGISGTIEASESTACVLGGTSTTQRNAGNFCVELGSGVTCTSGWLTGVTIDSSTDSAFDESNCTYAALRIKKATDKHAWEYGIHIGDDAAVTAIYIGDCSSSGYALHIPGDETSILMGTSAGTRSSFASGSVMVMWTKCMATTGGSAGLHFDHAIGYAGETTCQGTAIRGYLRILNGATASDASKIYEGAAGYFGNEGIMNGTSLQIAGVRGCIVDGGTYTNVSKLSSVWADTQLDEAVSGDYQLFYGSNNGDTELDYMINLWGTAGYFLKCEGVGGGSAWHSHAGTESGGEAGFLLCHVGGQIRKIKLYALA